MCCYERFKVITLESKNLDKIFKIQNLNSYSSVVNLGYGPVLLVGNLQS